MVKMSVVKPKNGSISIMGQPNSGIILPISKPRTVEFNSGPKNVREVFDDFDSRIQFLLDFIPTRIEKPSGKLFYLDYKYGK